MLLVPGLAFVLLLFFLWPFVVRGASFPIGPDGPVYLWWTRLASIDGLSATGSRPGVPGLLLVLQGTLGLSVVQATAALEVAVGIAVGLSSAALVRRSTNTAGSALAGLLAGAFAAHLAAGYLANLITASALIAASTALGDPRPRSAVLACCIVAGGGLAHPQFLLVCVAILLLAGATAWRTDRREALRLSGVAVGSIALAGIGLLAVRPGAPALDVDTSKDAFLRRAGLTSELRSAYVDRFVHRWTRYVQWVSLPLAVAGLSEPKGAPGRILRSWLAVTIAGVALALATGWLPADRFITFGFAVPIMAALGLVRLWRGLQRRRGLAIVVVPALTLAMLAGSAIAWNRQDAFLSDDEVRAATIANALIGPRPPGTPLAFFVNERDESVTFLATRAGNVIRASLPPARIRDVVVVVPPLGAGDANIQRAALERLTAEDLARAEHRSGSPSTAFVLRPFDRVDRPAEAIRVDPELVTEDASAIDPLEPSSRVGIAWASVATFVLLALVGYGWARVGLADAVTAAGAAPAIGAAVLILTAVGFDAVGIRLGTTAGALSTSVLGGGGGYLTWFVLQRRTRAHPSPEVDEQPAE